MAVRTVKKKINQSTIERDRNGRSNLNNNSNNNSVKMATGEESLRRLVLSPERRPLCAIGLVRRLGGGGVEGGGGGGGGGGEAKRR